MELAEHETIIGLNKADMNEGYFYFETSEKKQFDKLCRRIGGESMLLNVKRSLTQKDENGNQTVRFYQCKVPLKFFHPNNWSIGKALGERRATIPSEKQIAARLAFKNRSLNNKEK